jgi:hypothetical protein
MGEDYVIELLRTGEPLFKDKHVRGVLKIKKGGQVVEQFATLERGLNYTNIKIGTYEMEHSLKRTGTAIPCLRPTNQWISSVLIHRAYNDDAKWLEGCIAPFTVGNDAHYSGSTAAMSKLFERLGGFQNKPAKKVTLVVLNNYPNEHRTAEEWIAYRIKTAKARAKAAQNRAVIP